MTKENKEKIDKVLDFICYKVAKPYSRIKDVVYQKLDNLDSKISRRYYKYLVKEKKKKS